MTETAKPTQLEIYRGEVLPPEKAEELYSALPSHIKPAVFERNLMNALMANPALMQQPPHLVFREVAKAAGIGLLLDPILGEAYIIEAYNYKTKHKEPQLRIGYKGMCKLARQTGEVGTIYAHEVHEKDFVEADLGFPKVFHHKPKLFGDRGAIVGYVALITFKDGTFDFEPMSADQCREIRDRSDAYKAFKSGLIKTTPWSTDESEMSKKTALRRLLKRQAQSPELVDAIRIEDDAEFPTMATPALSAAPRDAGPPRAAAIEAPAETEEEATDAVEHEEAQTEDPAPRDDAPPSGAPEKPKRVRASRAKTKDGQVAEPQQEYLNKLTAPAEVVPFTVSMDATTFEKWSGEYLAGLKTSRSPAVLMKWVELNRVALDRMSKTTVPAGEKAWATVKKTSEKLLAELQGAPAGKAKKAAEPDITEVPDGSDPEKAIEWIRAVLGAVTEADDLADIYALKCDALVDGMFPPDKKEVMKIYRDAERRLGIE